MVSQRKGCESGPIAPEGPTHKVIRNAVLAPATAGPPAARAFEELLSEHLDALFRTALRLCAGQVADAEDLLQEAALRAFRGFGGLRESSAGRSWLFVILLRTHLNRTRADRRRSETVSTDLDDAAFEEALAGWIPSDTPEQMVDRWELRESIGAALDGLGPELRAVVWMVDVEGFHQREVASMLEIPEGTVASRLFRARRQLRDALDDSTREARARRHR